MGNWDTGSLVPAAEAMPRHKVEIATTPRLLKEPILKVLTADNYEMGNTVSLETPCLRACNECTSKENFNDLATKRYYSKRFGILPRKCSILWWVQSNPHRYLLPI